MLRLRVMYICTVVQVIQTIQAEDAISMTSQYTRCANDELVLRSDICDGIAHCEDGSDEIYVGNGFKCALKSTKSQPRRRCVLPKAMVHDDVADCDDASDLCFSSDQDLIPSRCYRCFDGSDVISLTQVCDGIIDCVDLSDECVCVKHGKRKNRQAVQLERNPICSLLRYSEVLKLRRVRLHKTPRRSECRIGEILCRKTDSKRQNDTDAPTRERRSTDATHSDVINILHDAHHCVTTKQICDGIKDCPLGDDEMYCPKDGFVCSGKNTVLGNFCDGKIDCPNFDDECSPECWLRHEYCDDVIRVADDETSMLQCRNRNENLISNNQTRSTSPTNYVTAYDVCDGVIDCVETETDEAYCSTSTHFYCIDKSPLFINWTNRLDGVRDCAEGSDECGRMCNHSRDSVLQQTDALIRNPILVGFVWIMGVMALGGNAIVLWQTFADLWEDRKLEKLGKLAKCNRIFVLNLSVADFLMGVYLVTIGTESAVSDGRYCVRDRTWRTSSTCVTLGFINQVSSQTSVFMLLLMTNYRLYGTLNPFKVERSAAVTSSIMSCVSMWMVSIIIALIPLADSLSDYFTESLWLPFPFLPNDKVKERDLREAVIRANTLTYNFTGDLPDLSWSTMLGFFRELNVTGLHQKWNYDDIRPFGYYNWYAICIPNLYPRSGDTAWAYAASVIIFNFCAFCYITIAYVIIYKSSSRPAVRKSVRKRSKQWRRDNKTMQKKIFFLVATDVMCWLPICILFILNLTRTFRVRRSVVDITGAILLPINSAINPLIYSNALWKLMKLFREKICPRSNNNEFLPFSSFRHQIDSTSSNDHVYSVRKMRNVHFASREDSTGESKIR